MSPRKIILCHGKFDSQISHIHVKGKMWTIFSHRGSIMRGMFCLQSRSNLFDQRILSEMLLFFVGGWNNLCYYLGNNWKHIPCIMYFQCTFYIINVREKFINLSLVKPLSSELSNFCYFFWRPSSFGSCFFIVISFWDRHLCLQCLKMLRLNVF